jgi:uncharacterized protein (TIGR03435 family)
MRGIPWRTILLGLLSLIPVCSIGGQEVQSPKPASESVSTRATFDVVSIKVDVSGEVGGAGDRFPKNGRWRWTRIGLRTLVMYAYDVSRNAIFGVPKSMEEPGTVFNIEARMPPDTTPARFRLMLQTLLADRFHFAMHREAREIPVITIEVAKGGSKLQKPTGECVQRPAKLGADQYACGEIVTRPQVSGQEISWEYVGRSVSMAELASTLSWSGNGPVFDNTGIQGLFDLDVKYQVERAAHGEDSGERFNRQVEYEHAVRNAFEKQAGLTVDLGMMKKHPMPVIVIDHVEMPTPN